MKLFITGIDTNVGKTVVSAIIARATGYDYWKPVQSGDLKNSDTLWVKKLCSNKIITHKETYRFKAPLSPHESSKKEGVRIDLNAFELPTDEKLVIEGAGGLMVPLNEEGDCMIDLIKQTEAQVILVSKNYLGSINHTLLSCQLLHSYGIQTLGIVINGEPNKESEEIISKISGVPIIGYVKWSEKLTAQFVVSQAKNFKFLAQ